MRTLFDVLTPSEERMSRLSRSDKIAYLKKWLLKARTVMFVPAILLPLACAAPIRYVPSDSPAFILLSLLAIFGTLPSVVLVVALTRSRLHRCVDALKAESWTDRSDVPILLDIMRSSPPIPYLVPWDREQLAGALAIHRDALTASEKADSVKLIRSCLEFYATSKSSPGYYAEADAWAVPFIETIAHIGGRSDIRMLRSLLKRARATKGCEAVAEAAECNIENLETRLAEEESAAVLLRAGVSPEAGLHRAVNSPSLESVDDLLRATKRPD
jgi:hypothetical protein